MGEDLPKEAEAEAKEGDAALIEFYSSFRDLFEFFCLNTTIHGTIRLVCSNSNKMKTAFWALLFLTSFAMLYWQFALIFNQYWAYPVVMSMSVHSEPKMFPAVTLCTLNPYRISPVNQDIAKLDNLARETLYNLYGFHIPKSTLEDISINFSGENPGKANCSTFHLDRNIALVKMGGKVGFRLCNTTGENCYNKVYISGVDAIQEWYSFHYMNIMSQIPSIIKMSQHDGHIKNLIYSCQYDGQPCRTSDHEHFHHPVYGSCFTLNKNGTDKFWKAFKPGIVYGLSLILKVDQKDHIPLLSTTAGVKVMIHRHNQTPFLEHEGFAIRPGIESTIGIKQDEVSRLGGSYGLCTNNGEDVNIKLLYNSTYTLQACLHSCFQHHMVEKCGCGYYFYPLPSGAEYCNYNKHPAWGHCFYLLYKELTDHHLICFSECPKLCNKDIAKVNIFYEQLDYYSWDESPEYNVTLVMSNMGSQWSLWFGSSVLSVVEMFEFLVDVTILSLIFFYRRLTAKRRHKVSCPPKVPSVSLTLEKYRSIEEGLAPDQDAEKSQASHENPSFVHDEGLPPYSKYNKHQMPELYPPVVLHRFKHQEDQGTCQDPKS
ncbi:amiloride-sensitive sodium channel subunit delta [Crotalus adamanteus]|uniref:Amiloride-sensitive sodium channel subunit delta n=1 Tax=Crotalus adamanteus TaxID=8729 RepID=A0AAW1ARM2_CROAD